MNSSSPRTFVTKRMGIAAAVALGALLATAPLAQAEPVDPSTPQAEVIVPIEATPTAVPKLKIKGVVTRRDADTFTVRDMNGVDTVVPPK